VRLIELALANKADRAKVGTAKAEIGGGGRFGVVASNAKIHCPVASRHLTTRLRRVGLSKGGRGQRGGLSEYAAKVGKAKQNIAAYRNAAEVAGNCHIDMTVLHTKTAHLSAIHSLPAE
jgi:hypothetical protein